MGRLEAQVRLEAQGRGGKRFRWIERGISCQKCRGTRSMAEPGSPSRRQKSVKTRLDISNGSYSVPRLSCSRSMASNRALKLPLPKLLAPLRWMISKNIVGRSTTGLVKSCSK